MLQIADSGFHFPEPSSCCIDARHEQAGADWLARHFVPGVVEPVRLHVEAKRYLCADPDYLAALSPASALSLRWARGRAPLASS